MSSQHKPRVYNLSWFSKQPGSGTPVVGARHDTWTISEQQPIGVVILYPALATPEILVGDNNKLEMLLLTQASYTEDRLRMRIRSQLKISNGLDPAKSSGNRALFVDVAGNAVGTAADRAIDIEAIPFGLNDLMTTLSGRFSAYIDKRAYQIFSNAGYKNLYRVTMSNKALEAAMGSSEVSAAGEPQDQLINKMLDKRSPWARQKDGKYYCFGVGGDDVDCTSFNLSDPIQSYHPVFHYGQDDLTYANLGHLSDVHMAARQQVLAKSKARVIDYWDMGSDQDLGICPWIGNVINICSKDMVQILNKLGESPADLLLIGGDLVDFLRMCYLSESIAKDVKDGVPSRVWKAVELGDKYTDHYKDGADMIAFFSVLMKYCRSYSMPAYAISGNHDCYWLPYGLSPRIDVKVAERRANEGIPSDHNLTFYEAILVFGETYRQLMSGLSSPFTPDMFDWFYMVFTPFTDFAVELPKQHLVGLGWGDREDLLDTPGTGHGFGHLPRSKDTISDEQLSLLTTAIGKKKKVLLMTHFTFVSYDYSIPVEQGDRELGDVYISLIKDYNQCNFGTFEQNRGTLFETHCAQNRDIQIILTGHSHRRALYLVDRVDSSWRKSVKTRHFDFDSFAHAKASYPDRIRPAIIVSDSGGTIPRFNYGGEFNGRGSDSPSGTLVVFDQSTGELSGISARFTDLCHPRIAVAMDYLDIQEDETVVVKFESDKFLIEEEKKKTLANITFEVHLNKDLTKRGYRVDGVAFYLKWSVSEPWRKIALTGAGARRFAISGASDVRLFSEYFAKNRSRGNFLAMRLNNPVRGNIPRYDFTSQWCWEFQVDSDTSGGGVFGSSTHKLYRIGRHKKRAEIPDFDWRRTNMPGKYK